jgi:hypothetical protein
MKITIINRIDNPKFRRYDELESLLTTLTDANTLKVECDNRTESLKTRYAIAEIGRYRLGIKFKTWIDYVNNILYINYKETIPIQPRPYAKKQ